MTVGFDAQGGHCTLFFNFFFTAPLAAYRALCVRTISKTLQDTESK